MMTRSTWKEEHQLHSSWEQFTRCVSFLSKNNSTTITQSSLNFTAKKVSGWISNICFWLCYTFTDLMATFQPQIDCVSSHCLTIPKGKWFSMLITSRKNENVATLLTSFMTSTMGSFSLAVLNCSKHMLQLKKSWSGQWIHFFAYYPQDEEQSSHDFQIRVAMLWSRTVQNYTRWALIDLESFLYSSCSKLEKRHFCRLLKGKFLQSFLLLALLMI